jgi:23S rRNA (guanosine2251-2'-O)-methyltransferase
MPGNSQRKGATRKGASRKGPLVGSGGQRRQGLEGRKPTPKASDRTGHPAARRARSAARRAEATPRPNRSGARTRKDGSELVYGRNPVVEALRAGVPVTAVYLQASVEVDERVREALTIAGENRLPLLEVSRTQLDDMSHRGVHQGLALAVAAYQYAEPADLTAAARDAAEPLLVMALDGVTDPRNLGAVVRCAGAFGAHGVLVPERRSAGMTASAWKASAGAAARVPVARATNLTRALGGYAHEGAMIVGLAAGGESLDRLDQELVTGPVVLVAGSEGRGLSRLVAATCDVVVGIPMSSATESLNAAVAAGIMLHTVSAARRR